MKKRRLIAGLTSGVLLGALLALLTSGGRARAANVISAITEYAIRFVQQSPASLPAQCTTGRDCIYVSSVDDKVYHRNAAGSDVNMEAAGGSTLQALYTAGGAGGGAILETASGGPLALSTGNDANKGLTIKANSATQSAPLFQSLDNSNNSLMRLLMTDGGQSNELILESQLNGGYNFLKATSAAGAFNMNFQLNGGILLVFGSAGDYRFLDSGGSNSLLAVNSSGVFAQANFDVTPAGPATLFATNATSASIMAAGVRATFNGPVAVVSQSAPGSPTTGDIWTDSTRLALMSRQDGISAAHSTTIFTGTASTTVSTATTATVVGTGVGTLTLPANWCAAGKVVRAHVGGVMTTSGTPGNYTFFFKLGATTIATTGTFTPQVSATTKGWAMDAILVFRSCGVSGSVMTDGAATYPSAAGARGFGDLNNNGSATTINTTGSLLLDAQVTLGSSGQTVVGTTSSWEIMN